MNHEILKSDNETRKFKFIKPSQTKSKALPEFLNPGIPNRVKDLLKAPKIKFFRDIKGRYF